MMAKRFDSVDDLLCLTGQTVGHTPSSSRHYSATKGLIRPSSSSGTSGHVKPSAKKIRENATARTEKAKNFPGYMKTARTGSHSDVRDAAVKATGGKPSARGEYLEFFESSHQPKIGNPRQPLKLNGKALQGKSQSQFAHSVFQPVSARTVSTDEDPELSDNDNVFCRKTKNESALKNNNYDAPFINSRLSSGFLAAESKDSDIQNQKFRTDRNSNYETAQDVTTVSQKFNSQGVANNMTDHALQSGNKAPLTSMENAYQNIKHKTPVNQVRQRMSTNLAEDYIKTCNMSAAKIQRWFRRWRAKRRIAETSVKQLLEAKKQERELAMATDKQKELSRDADRKRAREEKARLARQAAMQELQKRREEKRQFQQKLAEEELAFLQADGKVMKGAQKSSNLKKVELSRSNSLQQSGSSKDLCKRPASAASQNARSKRENTADSHKHIQPNDGSNFGDRDELVGNVRSENQESNPMSLSAASEQRTKTTIDDILETLKKLGVDDESETSGMKKTSSRLEWLDELEKNEYPSEHNESSADDQLRPNRLLSDEKLSNIMDYLHKIEANDRMADIDLELQKVNDRLDKPPLLVPSSEEIAQMELASQTASEVMQQMLKMRMELEGRKQKVQTLEKALNQQRDFTVRYAKETESEIKKKTESQRKQFETELSRRNCLIDQLLEDKKQLAEKYDVLHKQLMTITQTSHDKMKSMEDSHAAELKKLKELHAATEKLRREKWVKEETKRIKEMTVKGFQPELSQLIAHHKAELSRIKAAHDAELMAADERADRKYVHLIEELREQLAKEKQDACSRERELARQTYEKQLQQHEEILQQQRQRLYNEVREEKDRLAQAAHKQRVGLDRQQEKLEESQSIAIETLRKEYEMARKEQENRHATEIRQIKEQLTIEKEAWEENYRKKQETLLMQKEREMRELVKKERDREIEMAIQSLASDRDTEIKDCKRDLENQTRRIREKYEREVAELEKSERQIAEKYNQTKAKLLEVEGENERLKVALSQKELHANELKTLLDKRNEERDHISDVIRQEFADRIVAIEDENRRLKNEVSELKARHRLELERLRSENEVLVKAKEDEMEEVHRRVKEAIAKKDKQSEELVKQRDAAVRRADYAEQLLIEQGKKLLGKN